MFNDVFKSFTRTLGRIIAYLFVGFLLALVLGKCDVYAASSIWLTGWNGNTQLFTTRNQSNPYFIQYSLGTTNKQIRLEFNNSGALIKKGYYANVSMNFTVQFEHYSLDGETKPDLQTFTIDHMIRYYNGNGIIGTLNKNVCSFTYKNINSVNGDNMSRLYSYEGQFLCQELKLDQDAYIELNFIASSSVAFNRVTVDFSNFSVLTGVDQESLNQSVIDNANQNKNDIINNQDKNQQQTNERLDEVSETNKGIFGFVEKIWDGIIHLPENIWNLLKGGFEMIGGFISDMLDAIKGIFLPEPKCIESPNLLNLELVSGSQNGIDYVVNDDGSITLNGTATSTVSLFLNNFTFDEGEYVIYLYGKNENISLAFLRSGPKVDSFLPRDSASEYSSLDFSISRSGQLLVFLYEGSSFNNLTIKPMITQGTEIYDFSKSGTKECEDVSFWTWFKRLGNMIGNFFTNLLNGIIDGLKSLFIPDEDYFTNHFNELMESVENKMGVLAYPLTITIRTFEFLLTVEDTGSYIISWGDITVPNFENHVIIPAGTFNLSSILENPWLEMAHTLYMTFVSAYLLLAFFKFCNNKYSDMFGGDYDNTDYITVEETDTIAMPTDRGYTRYSTTKTRQKMTKKEYEEYSE